MPSSPPTMTCRLPRWAPHTPPETGESSTCTPLSLKVACSFRIIVGEPVERSAKIVPVAVPPFRAELQVRRRGLAPHVVDDEAVAGLDEVESHWPAHVSEPDESDAHDSPPRSV